MYYTTTLALVGATLVTFATAIPHSHNHVHKHHARDAEALADPVAELEERQVVTIYTTITQGAGSQAAPSYGAKDVQQQKQYQPQQQQSSSSTTSLPAAAAAAVSAQRLSGNPYSYQQPTSTSSSTSSAYGNAPTGGSPGGSTGSSSPVYDKDSNGNPKLSIQNNCGDSIYIGVGNDDMVELPKGQMKQSVMEGSHVAFKMGWTSNCAWESDISDGHGNAEVEFTMNGFGTNMSYDLSMIKGKPFMQYGSRLLLDGDCTQITCEPGVEDCPNAYNNVGQNEQPGLSLSCPPVPMYFEACTNGGSPSG